MTIPLQILLLMLLLGGVSGCTTARLIEEPDPEAAIAQLELGDAVEIIKQDGSKIRFILKAVDSENLYGTLDPPVGGKDVIVARADVRIVSVVGVDAGKTAATGAASSGAILIIIILVTFLSGTWIFG